LGREKKRPLRSPIRSEDDERVKGEKKIRNMQSIMGRRGKIVVVKGDSVNERCGQMSVVEIHVLIQFLS